MWAAAVIAGMPAKTRAKGAAALPPLPSPASKPSLKESPGSLWDPGAASKTLHDATKIGTLTADSLRRLLRVGLGVDPQLPVVDSFGATLGLYIPDTQRSALTRNAQEALVTLRAKNSIGVLSPPSAVADAAVLEKQLAESRRESRELHQELEQQRKVLPSNPPTHTILHRPRRH